jgi:hypothetical protein
LSVTVRHFTAEDVPIRSALLRDPQFQANITDVASRTMDDELAASQLRTIAEEQNTKQIFTVCRRGDEIIGFFWISHIDWRSQSCELSLALLPKFRRAFGLLLVQAALRHLYDELNMQVVIDQVLEHNVMLLSESTVAERSQIRSIYNQFTDGRWVTACAWSNAVEESWREPNFDRQRAKRAARIRTTLAGDDA